MSIKAKPFITTDLQYPRWEILVCIIKDDTDRLNRLKSVPVNLQDHNLISHLMKSRYQKSQELKRYNYLFN